MDQTRRFSQLERFRDWPSLVEELEKALPAEGDAQARARMHLQLGRLLGGLFLQEKRGLKHLQDAYKLNAQLMEALEEARAIYWVLGKLNMVQKLLDLELKGASSAEVQGKLLREQGDVALDLATDSDKAAGAADKASTFYASALEASGGQDVLARDCLLDAQTNEDTWRGRLQDILALVEGAAAEQRGALLLRGARLARRFAPGEVESLLGKAYAAAPLDRQIAALFEGALVEGQRQDELIAAQQQILGGLAGEAKAEVAFRFASRWAMRFQNQEVAARFVEASMMAHPTEGAFLFLKELLGTRDGNWKHVASMAENAALRLDGDSAMFFFAQAGQIHWRQLGSLIQARQAFAQLAQIAPTHPAIEAFELQIGEPVGEPVASVMLPSVLPTEVAAPEPAVETPKAPATEVTPPAPEAVQASVAAMPLTTPPPTPEPSAPAPVFAPQPAAAPQPVAAEPAPVAEPEPNHDEEIAELRALAVKQEGAKRYNEYVKTIIQLATLVPNRDEKVDLLARAADMYVTRFANQAEAIKVYEQLLEIDPEHDVAARYLKEAYEKRRDWEKLLGLQRREIDRMPPGAERNRHLFEMAKLASERVRKPDVNIDLWRAVLDGDPENSDALANLSKLYEGARDYQALVGVLEKQAEQTYDTAQKVALLVKLGQMYGDRLNDDEGAVRAWRSLLLIEPNDRRAQEALKKKYLALGRWDDLEVFYAESGKWDEFIRTLETQEAKENAPVAKIGLLMKIAQLWADKKAKSDKASKNYERVLEIDPRHLAAAEALMPIYAQAQNAKGLAGVIEVKLLHEGEPGARLGLLREVSSLYEGKLKDAESAFARALLAFEIAPGEDQSRDDAERLAKATGRWDDLVASYRKAIAAADDGADGELAIALRLRLGRVLVDEVGRVDDALAEYRAVYDAESDNHESIVALERLYKQTGRFAELLAIYEKKRELAASFDDKRETLYAIARLYEVELKDLNQAISTYRSVLEEDPADGEALRSLDELFRRTEQWDDYVEVLRQRIDLETDDNVLVDLKFRLGQTLEQHRGDTPGALANYREILFLNQNHEGARRGLEAMLTHETLGAEAASILEPVYELLGDSERLIQVLEILARSEEDPARRVALLRKIGRTAADALNDPARAFQAAARALREDPTNIESRSELEGYAQRAQLWDQLDLTLQEIASSLTEPQLARDYWMRLGAIDEQLGRIDDAASRYQQMLQIDAADDEALGLLDALYRRTERWNDLISVFRRRIDLAIEPEEREQHYAHMAAVYEEKLGQPEQAIAAYREVLASDESSLTALAALDALFSRQKMWDELAENLDAQLRLAITDEEQLALMLRLASHREERMGQVDQAIEIFRQVLDRDATNAAALAALERLGREEQHELTIADILEPLYRQSGDYGKLIGVYEVQVRRTSDAGRKVSLLQQIAQLHEDAAGDSNAAFDTMARALASDPAQEETQQALDRLARSTGRFADLARVLEDLGGQQQDPALAWALLAMSARVYENDIGDIESAIGHYRKVLELDPLNLEAAESLERLFRQTERYQELSLVLQKKAEIVDPLEDKKNALFQAASIEEDVLGKKESAIGVYTKILEADPEDLTSIDALIKLFLDLSRWEELLDVFGKKVDLVDDPEDKKRIYYEQGAVYERELRDVPRAIDTYQRVLELDPDDLTALSRLDVLYNSAQNWTELLAVLQHEADLVSISDPSEAVSYQYRIGELYEKHLDDVGRAVEIYRDILTQQPDHEPTLAALETLKQGREGVDPLPAALVLEPVYEAMGDWQRLISCLEVQVRFADDGYRKVELLHRIARLYEESIGEIAPAFDTYARALPADNSSEDTLGALERLAVAIDDGWPRVASLYDTELERLADNNDRYVELGLRVAQIYEVQIGDVDAAVARYRGVLKVDAENIAALSSLDRLFSQTQRWSELADVLGQESNLAQSADEILQFKFRLGQLQQLHLNNTAAAIAAYREILEGSPEHAETLQALEGLFEAGTSQVEIAEIVEPLYESSGEWEKLVRVNEARLAHLTDPTERMGMYYRLAELASEKILDTALALEVFIRALREQPLDERAGEEAERFAGVSDNGWERLANAYADITTESQDDAVKATIGKRLARLYEQDLGDIENAEATYRYVLSVRPLDVDALSELDRITSAQEKWGDLAAVLEQRVQATTDRTELVELYTRLGQIYEEQLGQVDDAVRVYRKIFDELDKPNEQAIAALERLYTLKEAPMQLLEVHERELENAIGDSAEADVSAKMARILSGALGQPQRAIEIWARVLELRGDEPESLGALADLYEQLQRWEDLTDILARQADIAPSDEERVAALVRRARNFSVRLGSDEQALEDWYRVLDIDYANIDALRAIAEIRRKQGDASELVRSLHDIVDRASAVLDAPELKAVFRELARTYAQSLEQPYEAADAWTRLLEVDPFDAEGLDSLEALYRKDERWQDVINIKMQRAEALQEPAEKIRELLEVAGLWEHSMGDRDGGRVAFERILVVEPTHEQAYLALEELHTQAARWEPLIELYLARLDTREEVSESTTLLRKIAKVFEEKLGDKGQAFDALLNAFGQDYHDNETVRYLERMAQATGRWGELLQSANQWLKETEDAPTKIILMLRLAKWYGEDLGRVDYAQAFFGEIVKLDPNNVPVMRQAASLFRKNQQWQQLWQTLTNALNIAVMDVDRRDVLTDLGDVCMQQLKDVEQATGYYQRALEVAPHHVPAIEALEKIYAERGDNQALVQLLLQKVPGLTEQDQILSTRIKAAGLYENALQQPEEAARVYREVLELDAGNLLAMKGLERTYMTLQLWAELIQVLEMQLDVVPTERERIDTLFKIASVQEERFIKADLAAVRLEQLLEIDPTHEAALEALARCYGRLRQWHDLVNTYERHISTTLDRAKKIELYGKIALVFSDELSDSDRAIEAYRNIIDIDDQHIPALEALSRLFDKLGDANQAIEFMTRVADLTSDGTQRVEMYYRIGRALDEKLGDRVMAQERYEMALDLNPSHLPTLAALRQISLDSGDWDRAARFVDQEQMNTQVPRARAKLLVELGKLRQDYLGEHDLAISAFEQAYQNDPDNEDAALPLMEFYATQQRWAEAEPLVDMLVRRSGKRERSEQQRLFRLQGKVAAAIGNDEKALKAYTQAVQLDLTDQESIRGLAEVNFRMKDWAGSLTNFQKVLTSLGEEETEARADIYHRLGCIKREQGQAKQAINNFEKALSLVAGHRPSLDALVNLYNDLRDWKQVAEYKRQILDNVIDGEERYKLLVEIADVWEKNEKNAAKTLEALEEARDLKPDDHKLLFRMMPLYQEVKNWPRMIDTIQAAIDLDPDPKRKARYYQTQGQIFRDFENDPDRALECFNLALDNDPTWLEPFERIAKLLTSQKNWRGLARAYKKLIERINGKGNRELEFKLFHDLGIIYRDRLKEIPKALEAFKAASLIKPEEMQERQILAELHELNNEIDSAIEQQEEILKIDATRVEPYRALFRLFQKKGAYDEAWCLSVALCFLRKANEEEKQFYENYKLSNLPQVKSRLDNTSWLRLVFHEEVNNPISKIFEMLSAAALAAKVDDLRRQNKLPALDARFLQDPRTSTVTFTKTFGWVVNVLAIPSVPQLYVRSDLQGGLTNVTNQPPAVVAGQGVLSGMSPLDLTFFCGKHLTLYRGEFFIRTIFATQTELEVILYAGIKIARPDFALPAQLQAQVMPVAQVLASKMQPMQVEVLKQAVKLFFEQGAKVNLKKWIQGVELTAARAGLLLCSELDIARKIIQAEPQLPGDLSPADKIKELLLYSVSSKYFEARKAIGVTIG
jgi:tetratricopeptide (TPR) repeat protein